MRDNLKPHYRSFDLMSLNIQSINVKFDKITILWSLKEPNFMFSTISIQDTWLENDQDTSLSKIPEYNLIKAVVYMGLLPDTKNCGLRMHRECWERFPRRRLQRKPPVSDPGMHNGTCVTHVPWCMSGSLIHGGRENVSDIPGACAPLNFTYLATGPWKIDHTSEGGICI